MFYMVIKDETIIDVLSDIQYVRTQVVHNRLMVCDKKYAEGIISSDTTSIWYVPELISENVKNYPVVTLSEIDEEKYNSLKEILELNHSIDYEQKEPESEEEEPTEEDLLTLEFVRESKIKEMSNACNKKIISGFDIELSDGKLHHFDFTLEEQANFMFFKSAIDAGATVIPYHASNEPCRFFSVEEILKIIDTGVNIKTYETTYFNSLKQYIKSLKTIEEINAVYYGILIPENFYSEVMITLYATKDMSNEV